MTPRHPTTGFGDSGAPVSVETVREISQDKAGLAVAAHERNCPSLQRVHTRLDTMEQTQRTHETFINQYLGERKFIRYVVPVLFGLLGSSVSALIIAAVFRALIGQMGLVAK